MSIGLPLKRVDAEAKVTGSARYTDDNIMLGMRHAKYVRSNIAHGKVLAIDATEALALHGVEAVFTHEDVPTTCFRTAGHAWSLDEAKRDVKDRRLLTDHVRHFGDGVAIVVARDPLVAEKAAALVKVTYEPLPVMTDAESALADDAYLFDEGRVQRHVDLRSASAQERADAGLAPPPDDPETARKRRLLDG